MSRWNNSDPILGRQPPRELPWWGVVLLYVVVGVVCSIGFRIA